jgi:superfamily II DNA/RNA helicase
MMSENKRWEESLQSLASDPSFQHETAQIRAKALLFEVSGVIPDYRWSYAIPTVIRNISAASFELGTLSRSAPDRLRILGRAARQIALVWESLAKLHEGVSQQTALINAAFAYELAGYQANAACLSHQVWAECNHVEEPTLVQLSSAFLQRLFVQTMRLAEEVRKEPPTDTFDDRIWDSAALGLAGEGFANGCRYFLSGDADKLKLAMESFEHAEKVFSNRGAVVESNLTRNVRDLLPLMQMRSTWTVLRGLVDSVRWERYLRLLARGTGSTITRSPSVSELWPSQMTALSGGLLSDSSKIVKMPTSAGKTRIAELAMVHTLVTIAGAKCVYVAPYRALVSELEQAFLSLFGDLGYRVSTILGAFESDDFEELLTSDADILVMTPEKLDLLERAKPDFLNRVRLFILDEAQIVNDARRGVKFELLFTRLKRRLPNARFLFLSAVLPQETLEDFARWFNADPKRDVLTSDWRPSIQRHAKFEWRGRTGVLRYEPTDIPLLKEFVSGVIEQTTYEFVNQKTGRLNHERYPEVESKAETAAELAFKFAYLGPVLVFCSQQNHAEAVGESIKRRIDLCEANGESVPLYFRDHISTRSVLSAEEWLGADHKITTLLKNGIAVHHGDLPEVVRKSVEADFRERYFRILVATNTLAQGVNLPIRTVIVHSCWRHRSDGTSERIMARDYWNIAGRAGRAGRETEGTIIHIVRNATDAKDFEYYRDKRENVEPVSGALFELLNELVNERMTEAALVEKLDPEVLALMVEEGNELLSENVIQSIFDGTLAQGQASRHEVDSTVLRTAFRKASEGIGRSVSRTLWPVYSSTGLSTTSCEILREYVLNEKDTVYSLLKFGDWNGVDALLEMFLEVCSTLPEMRPDREYGGSYSKLLRRWIDGAGVTELTAEFGMYASSPEELAKFIEDYFAYRLPWGMSAFTRIAQKVLELQDEDISVFVKFLPSMVKFGVPNPQASWALSAGVPSRRMGMKIADKYIAESESPKFTDFLGWIGKLDPETLRSELDLKSPTLEEVSRALSRSSHNPLLTEHASIVEILPYATYVVGVSFGNRASVAMSARAGQSATLVRDYDNLMDRNAVKVQLKGRDLGYLEKQLAQLAAPDMDCGVLLKSTIIDIEKGNVPQIRILIERES